MLTSMIFAQPTPEILPKKQVIRIGQSNEFVVYAKLPKESFIPAPIGNYNPDWAIALKEGTVKHIYFVAETKGSMS